MRSAWGPQSAFPRPPDARDAGLGHGTGVRRGWGTTHGSPVCAAAAGRSNGRAHPTVASRLPWRNRESRWGTGGRAKRAPTQRPKESCRGGFQPPEKPSPLRGEGGAAHAVTDVGSSFPHPIQWDGRVWDPPLRKDQGKIASRMTSSGHRPGYGGRMRCAPTQVREKTRPTAPPGRKRQAQSGNSVSAQMTRGMSGSGARRWSVRKHCRAGQISENPRLVVLVPGGPGESGLRDPGGADAEPWSRRERPPAILSPLSHR